jgi:hypothetical protein
MKSTYQEEVTAAVFAIYPELSGLAVDTTKQYAAQESGIYCISVYGPDVTLYEKNPSMYIDGNCEPQWEHKSLGVLLSFRGSPNVNDSTVSSLRDITLDIDEW